MATEAEVDAAAERLVTHLSRLLYILEMRDIDEGSQHRKWRRRNQTRHQFSDLVDTDEVDRIMGWRRQHGWWIYR